MEKNRIVIKPNLSQFVENYKKIKDSKEKTRACVDYAKQFLAHIDSSPDIFKQCYFVEVENKTDKEEKKFRDKLALIFATDRHPNADEEQFAILSAFFSEINIAHGLRYEEKTKQYIDELDELLKELDSFSAKNKNDLERIESVVFIGIYTYGDSLQATTRSKIIKAYSRLLCYMLQWGLRKDPVWLSTQLGPWNYHIKHLEKHIRFAKLESFYKKYLYFDFDNKKAGFATSMKKEVDEKKKLRKYNSEPKAITDGSKKQPLLLKDASSDNTKKKKPKAASESTLRKQVNVKNALRIGGYAASVGGVVAAGAAGTMAWPLVIGYFIVKAAYTGTKMLIDYKLDQQKQEKAKQEKEFVEEKLPKMFDKVIAKLRKLLPRMIAQRDYHNNQSRNRVELENSYRLIVDGLHQSLSELNDQQDLSQEQLALKRHTEDCIKSMKVSFKNPSVKINNTKLLDRGYDPSKQELPLNSSPALKRLLAEREKVLQLGYSNRRASGSDIVLLPGPNGNEDNNNNNNDNAMKKNSNRN